MAARRVDLSCTILIVLLLLLFVNFANLIHKSFLKTKSNEERYHLIVIRRNLSQTSLLFTTTKCKWLKRPTLYYHNSTASFNLTSLVILTSGDVHPHPGPTSDTINEPKSKGPAAKCPKCTKPVQRNHKRLMCGKCYDLIHVRCASNNTGLYKTVQAKQPGIWTCSNCTLSELPFFKVKDLVSLDSTTDEKANDSSDLQLDFDSHLDALARRQKQLSFMHLNTQSMTSTFDDLLLVIQRYDFDIITLSETWLKDNPQLLSHVSIAGYVNEFKNRDKIRGGGVGAYIKENVKYKRRKDIESRYPELEHLWLELQGRNKNSNLLLGTIYRSARLLGPQQWLAQMENMLSDLSTSWDGLLVITGDLNIDMLKLGTPLTRQYTDLLYTFNLTQHVEKATRVTGSSETLIDHIVSNDPKRVTYTDVLPCSNVSDHDAPYACLNIRVERFVPRYKLIRNERRFQEEEYIRDFTSLPFSIIQIVDDPDEKLDMFTNLITECIERHAPLKRTMVHVLTSKYQFKQLIDKVTRPISGKTIDLIFTSKDDNVVKSGVLDIGLSDHLPIFITRKINPRMSNKQGIHTTISYRKRKGFIANNFDNDLAKEIP